MKQQKFSLKKRLISFKYAFNGLIILFKDEHNALIHLFATICVIIAGFLFEISSFEWIVVIFAIGFVWTAEILNTAIENMADFIFPEKHEKIKRIKDLSAAAVLISAITALIIGLIIFIPEIIECFFIN
ncbi:MAG: diacylglycerol kinase family protein [Bacteroidales bacterium]|jgi:diacylglycerol kinase (ATP)|nr:diacylglycerol kinase family protein [Bacteroidales bacterium]